jgi:chromosome segregation ATPase
MVQRKAKMSPSGEAQIEAAETALKMARQNAKSAKARVRSLKSELKVARKRHKRLRKDMRAAKRILGQVSKPAAIPAVRAATKKKPSTPKPLARASAERRQPPAARKQATKKVSAVQSAKLVRLVRHRNPPPAARPLSAPQAMPQLTEPPAEIPGADSPLTNTAAN